MFIKLSLICMLISSIIATLVANDVEKPLMRGARGRQFFGWLAVNHHPFINPVNRRWRGELSLSIGSLPLTFATAVEFQNHRQSATTTLPCNSHYQIPQSLPEDVSNSVSSDAAVMGIESDDKHDDVKPTEIPFSTTTTTTTAAALMMTSEAPKMSTSLRTLKLEDYDEITFDPALEDDKSSDDGEDLNAVTRVRRQSENDVESTTTALDSSTTISREEDSTFSVLAADVGSSSNQVVTTMLHVPQLQPPQEFYNGASTTINNNNNNNNNVYPYPPSSNSYAQYIYITTNKPPVLRNYYDFYPSQPDPSSYYHHRNNYYNFIPLYGATTKYPHHSAFAPIYSPVTQYSSF